MRSQGMNINNYGSSERNFAITLGDWSVHYLGGLLFGLQAIITKIKPHSEHPWHSLVDMLMTMMQSFAISSDQLLHNL